MTHKVFVPYYFQGYTWTNVCAKMLLNFGLPGDAYVTAFTETGIEFLFNDPEDAFRAQLMI